MVSFGHLIAVLAVAVSAASIAIAVYQYRRTVHRDIFRVYADKYDAILQPEIYRVIPKQLWELWRPEIQRVLCSDFARQIMNTCDFHFPDELTCGSARRARELRGSQM